MGLSRQENWSGLPCPPPGDLSNPGIKPVFPALAGLFFTTGATWEAQVKGGSVSRSVVSDSLRPHGLKPPDSSDMEFPMHEYWSGLPFPPPGNLPDPGIKPGSPALQADSLLSELPGSPNC